MTAPAAGWVEKLRRRGDVPPPATREPLALERSRTVIGSIERALAERARAEGLPVAGAEGKGWVVEGEPDAALDALARWLDARRLCSRWRGETLAVVDERGATVARVERAAVRALGIATHAVHLVGRRPDGRWWVQLRAHDKSIDPGLWDTLMGGLVAAGESVAQTLARETQEEAGLPIGALGGARATDQITVRRPVADGYMIEHIAVHEAVVPEGVVPVNRDGEVARFECLDTAALLARLKDDAFTLEAALILLGVLERAGALDAQA